MRSCRILLAGSLADERRELRAALEFEGHRVSEAGSAHETLQGSFAGLHHVLILASRLEGIEPHDLCRAIRPQSEIGIIVVAAQGTREGRIDALNAGADDYLAAPIVLREICAGVRALLRRVVRLDGPDRRVHLQDRVIDFESHQIRGPGQRVCHLTPKEYLVLQCLVAHANRPFTHQSLASTVWQRDGAGEVEYIRTVVRQLRRKLEPDPENPLYILTERSVGYRFQSPSRPIAASAGTSHLALAG